MTEQRLKACPEDARYGAFTLGKNTYVRTWGEGVFRELTALRILVTLLSMTHRGVK